MSKHAHAADHTAPLLNHNPNDGASPPPPKVAMDSSPPTLLKMATSSSSGDLTRAGTTAETKPLTMFYNGGVAVFHLPQDKAEGIMKLAAGDVGGGGRGIINREPQANHGGEELLAKLREEMPIASKRSLQRFFQKRKERLYRH